MQTICTSLQTSTPHHSIFTGQMLFLMPNRVKALKAKTNNKQKKLEKNCRTPKVMATV